MQIKLRSTKAMRFWPQNLSEKQAVLTTKSSGGLCRGYAWFFFMEQMFQ